MFHGWSAPGMVRERGWEVLIFEAFSVLALMEAGAREMALAVVLILIKICRNTLCVAAYEKS
jgi:hypothetical protein